MSEVVKVYMLLAKMVEDTEPCVVAAVDASIWEHWTDEEELAWVMDGKKTWGTVIDTEFRTVMAEFAPQDLVDAFATPTVKGSVAA